MSQKFEPGPKFTQRVGLFIILCILAIFGGLTVKFLQWLF